MKQKSKTERQRDSNENICCSLFQCKSNKKVKRSNGNLHPVIKPNIGINKTLSKSSTNRSKEESSKNTFSKEKKELPEGNNSKINIIQPEKENHKKRFNVYINTINNSSRDSPQNTQTHNEENIDQLKEHSNDNDDILKEDDIKIEKNISSEHAINWKHPKNNPSQVHTHQHSTCEIKSIKTNPNNINYLGHKKASTDQCDIYNNNAFKDKQSNDSSNIACNKNIYQSSLFNQQHQQYVNQHHINLNKKYLNRSYNNSQNPNQSIPPLHLIQTTKTGINAEHITSNSPEFPSITNNNNTSSLSNTEPITNKDQVSIQLNYLSNSPSPSVKEILKQCEQDDFYNLTESEDEHNNNISHINSENSFNTFNDNASMVSSHIMGTKSMADINDRISVLSRSICGSRKYGEMFPHDNESVLYDLDQQRQTQSLQNKITKNETAIKKYRDDIAKLKEQIQHCEELTKNYSRHIEKEQRISEELRIMINYLHLHKENNI